MQPAKKVLVIDDDRTVLDLMKTILEERGFQVHTAATSREALRMLRDNLYDFAFLDLVLPDMNGILLSQEIRKLAPNLLDHTVFMTGVTLEEGTIDYFQSFSGGFLRKPLRLNTIDEAIGRVT
jgi:two-component system sensor histidine kinase TorS